MRCGRPCWRTTRYYATRSNRTGGFCSATPVMVWSPLSRRRARRLMLRSPVLFDWVGRHEPAATIVGFATSPLIAVWVPELDTTITRFAEVRLRTTASDHLGLHTRLTPMGLAPRSGESSGYSDTRALHAHVAAPRPETSIRSAKSGYCRSRLRKAAQFCTRYCRIRQRKYYLHCSRGDLVADAPGSAL